MVLVYILGQLMLLATALITSLSQETEFPFSSCVGFPGSAKTLHLLLHREQSH